MASISVTMQIAIIEAFRSEAIKPKEEFAWSFKPRKEWVLSRFTTKLLLRLFFKDASADSVATRKKLNKKRTNKRIVKSASIKRSSSQRYFHGKNKRWKCEKIQSKSKEYKGK